MKDGEILLKWFEESFNVMKCLLLHFFKRFL